MAGHEANERRKEVNTRQVRSIQLLGNEMAGVETLTLPLCGSSPRVDCVDRFSCASIFARCFCRSPSFSFTDKARSMRRSGVSGREVKGGCMRISNTASRPLVVMMACLQDVKMASPTRNKNPTPVQDFNVQLHRSQ